MTDALSKMTGNFKILAKALHSDTTMDLLYKSANLVSVPRGDRIKAAELNSEPADLVNIMWLLVFTPYRNGILTECNDR